MWSNVLRRICFNIPHTHIYVLVVVFFLSLTLSDYAHALEDVGAEYPLAIFEFIDSSLSLHF